MWIYTSAPIHLHGVVLNQLSTGTKFTLVRQGILNVLFPSGFPTETMYAFLTYTCYMHHPSRPLHLIILIMFEKFKLCIHYFCHACCISRRNVIASSKY
jgi:hypothetical protein